MHSDLWITQHMMTDPLVFLEKQRSPTDVLGAYGLSGFPLLGTNPVCNIILNKYLLSLNQADFLISTQIINM